MECCNALQCPQLTLPTTTQMHHVMIMITISKPRNLPIKISAHAYEHLFKLSNSLHEINYAIHFIPMMKQLCNKCKIQV